MRTIAKVFRVIQASGLEQTARIGYQVRLKATSYLMAYLYT